MRYTYTLDIDDSLMEELDDAICEYSLDDHLWYENKGRVIVTENERIIDDLEQIFAEFDIEFTREEEEL